MCVSRNVYEMVSYTPTLLKKFAAQPRGEGLFIAKGGGERFCVTKMKFRSSARPDLSITRNRNTPTRCGRVPNMELVSAA